MHIHWYVTDRCNMDCAYCFKPDFHFDENPKSLETIAQLLVENNVEKVTIGGGEPSLIDIDNALKILKEGNVYVSYHTNGSLLQNMKIRGLSQLVDEIALPIDSSKRVTQRKLRGEEFMPIFERLAQIAIKIQKTNTKLGYHTVFTELNNADIPKIYDRIKSFGFDYWRIYEFNSDLARQRVLSKAISTTQSTEQTRLIAKFERLKYLEVPGTLEKGYSDCLLAKFLLMEEKMKQHNDKRVQFVGVRDSKEPYAFLDNSGRVRYYAWFSGRERKVVGNITKENMADIEKRLKEINENPVEFAEDEFNSATLDLPVWARLENGEYLSEEVEAIGKSFLKDVEHLAKLYKARQNFK